MKTTAPLLIAAVVALGGCSRPAGVAEPDSGPGADAPSPDLKTPKLLTTSPRMAPESTTLPLTLGAPFADCAVLQREMPVPVWGWATTGDTVTVSFAGQKKTATADGWGKWTATLDPLKASFEPAEMVISDTKGKSIAISNILVGEVWLASGQSNMQWAVSGRGNTSGSVLLPGILKRVEAKQARYPVIREFTVNNVVAMMHPIEKAEGSWKKGDDFSGYSAIAFAFAYNLFQELQVPIGILNCSFSQTSIQSWVPRIGFRDGKDEYTQAIYKRVLETDPLTPEHKTAWDAFYKSLEDQIAENDARIERGEAAKTIGAKTPGNTAGNRDASWLYNGKLSPVVPYAIRGGIWNQGYANSGEGIVYYNNLHSLVRGWRLVWGRPELPVYFHQFYTPGGGSEVPTIGGSADMRLGTWMARDIPNSGMASQIDIGGTIHYQHKAVPGQRLALHALKNQYGKKVVVDGPMFKSYTVEGDKLIVEFEDADDGLVVAEARSNAYGKSGIGLAIPNILENGESSVKLVYVADKERIWYPAEIKLDGSRLIVTSPRVKSPRGVSYATGGVAFRPSLYNRALLPATPFVCYDNEMVTRETWPDEKLKIADEVIDPKTVGKIYEWRKMPILSTQFRDNAVFQAGKPLTIWGSTRNFGEWTDEPADGDVVIHFSFAGVEKTIEVTPDMAEWKVTLPPMKPSAEPHTLKVSATLDGELVHERTITGIVLGEVWYVAAAGGKLNVPRVKPSGQIIRVMGRKCRRTTSPTPSRFSVAVSRTPKNKYASIWKDVSRGFAADLGNAIAARTGTPVGIIFMSGQADTELKNWMSHTALAEAPSLIEDYKVIGAKYPGTPYYNASVQRYIGAWKSYWKDDIASMIATRAVPEGWGAWGEMPSMGSAGSSTAGLSYNILTHSFMPTTLRGVIFLAGPESAKTDQGANFASEMSALANSWKRGFGDGAPFFYTMPDKDQAPKIAKPTGIKGKAVALEGGDWSEIEKRIDAAAPVGE